MPNNDDTVSKCRLKLATQEAVTALNEKVEIYNRNLRETIEKNEQVRKNELAKSDATLDVRLESMNQFRHQIEQERSTFITRDQHDILRSELMLEIKPLQIAAANRAGVAQGRDWTLYVLFGILSFVAVAGLFIH